MFYVTDHSNPFSNSLNGMFPLNTFNLNCSDRNLCDIVTFLFYVRLTSILFLLSIPVIKIRFYEL